MNSAMLFLVFILAAISDWVWAKYITNVADKNVLKASFFSSIIVLFAGIFTISYINDYKTIFAGALGAFVGTAISLKYAKIKT